MHDDFRSETLLPAVVRALFRHKGKAGLFFLAAVGGAILWNVFCPVAYRSEGKLLVRLGRENATLDPTTTLGHAQVVAIPQSREQEVNSMVEVLTSRGLAEKVVDTVGPAEILATQKAPAPGDGQPPPQSARDQTTGQTALAWKDWLLSSVLPAETSQRERAIRKFAKGLDVAAVAKSNIVRIAYDADTPERSQAILEQFIQSFLAEHVRLNRPSGAHEFLREQTARVRTDLDQCEQSLRALKDQTGLIWPEGRRETLQGRVGQLENDLLRTNVELAAAESAVKNLREKLAALPGTQVVGQTAGFGNEGTDRMRDQLYALKVREEEARAKYAEGHPKLQELREQAAAARAILDREERTRNQVTTAPNKVFEAAQQTLLGQEVSLASLRAKAGSLDAQLAESRDELRVFHGDEVRIAKLQREQEIQEGNYRKYAVVLEEARIDKAMEAERMSNIGVAQAPTCDMRPARPRKLWNLLAGVAVGLLGAIGLAVFKDYLDRSFLGPEDVEKRLKLPALASIPRLRRRERVSNGRT